MTSGRSWAKKHRKILLLAAGVVGVGIGSYYYIVSSKGRANTLQEQKERHNSSAQKEIEDRVQAQLESHFESIQRISDSTTLPSILSHLKNRLFELVSLSDLTNKLNSGKEDPQTLSSKEKFQHWQDLKVLSFTRSVCAMCSLTLLQLFVRTQLNILGRCVYIDTARDMSLGQARVPHKPVSMSCQHKFIAFADYFPQKGIDRLITDVHSVVEKLLKSKSLKQPYQLTSLRDLFSQILQSFQGNRETWELYLLPENNSLPYDLAAANSVADAARLAAAEPFDSYDDNKLEQLMFETRSVLASKEFAEVLSAALDAVLVGVIEEMSSVFSKNPEAGIPLVTLLPAVANTASGLMDYADENKFTQILAELPQLRSFCALVYGSASSTAELVA